jgi:nitrate/nitrite-specific signal transduction histidine kinase
MVREAGSDHPGNARLDRSSPPGGISIQYGVPEIPNGLHFGLQGLRERAAALGAKLEITTAPGKGTRVTILLPLEHVL